MPNKDMQEYEILKKLIGFRTISGTKEGIKEYWALVHYLQKVLKEIGMDVRIIEVNGKPNIYAEKNIGAKQTILFAAHYDVVMADEEQFKAKEDEERIYGRGASDDKGAIAILIKALGNVIASGKLKKNVKLLITCDEEIGGKDGLGYITDKMPELIKADVAFLLDGGIEGFYLGCSGVVGGKIIVKGKSAHAGYDFKAENPIIKLVKIILRLNEFKKKREEKRSELYAPQGSPYEKIWGRFNITTLNAGTSFNIIPDKAIAGFDMRTLPEEDIEQAKKELLEFIKDEDVQVRFEVGHKGYIIRMNEKLEEIKKAIENEFGALRNIGELGGTDGTMLAKHMPVVVFGPIESNANIHQKGEFIRKEIMQRMIRVVERIIS